MADVFDRLGGDVFDRVAPTPEFPGGKGGEFRGRGATGAWEPEQSKPVRNIYAIGGMGGFAPGIREAPETVTAKQQLGALTKGGMKLGQAVMEIPKHTMWLAGNIMELGPGGERRAPGEVLTGMVGKRATKAYTNLIKQHKQGQEAILKAHPLKTFLIYLPVLVN